MANVTRDEGSNAQGRRQHACNELAPILVAGYSGAIAENESNNENDQEHRAKEKHAKQQIANS
jgi:hypothetical protein